MSWNIRYTKDHLAKAAAKEREAFAIGYCGAVRAEAFMWLKAEDSCFLWLMAHEVNQGKSPADAFKEVERKLAEWAEKRRQKELAEVQS